MLTTNRDCRRVGERFAIPTIGEIEGKLIVSEVVASCCLRELLGDDNDQPLASIRRRVKRTLQDRCKKKKLNCEDTEAAVEYAFQFLDAAVEAVGAYPASKSGCETGRRRLLTAASKS
ncbi:hypothetical protein [Rhizobium leucaenae]|uniref:hypothetical protein n=1 Tax=Rhizobium leucaenae TaxID=29450 RepID=UPI0007EE5F58|nr:hypothetical protein [Rhizobium leucaenae]MBB6303757.1 hypothetical protein [Rhizobium leucaenae]